MSNANIKSWLAAGNAADANDADAAVAFNADDFRTPSMPLTLKELASRLAPLVGTVAAIEFGDRLLGDAEGVASTSKSIAAMLGQIAAGGTLDVGSPLDRGVIRNLVAAPGDFSAADAALVLALAGGPAATEATVAAARAEIAAEKAEENRADKADTVKQHLQYAVDAAALVADNDLDDRAAIRAALIAGFDAAWPEEGE